MILFQTLEVYNDNCFFCFCFLFEFYSAEKEISYVSISDSVTHKLVLAPDKKYNISCLLSSALMVEFSRPGKYYIDRIICSDSSKICFLQPFFQNINVYIEDIYATNYSTVNIESISKYILFDKEIVRNGSCIVK